MWGLSHTIIQNNCELLALFEFQSDSPLLNSSEVNSTELAVGLKSRLFFPFRTKYVQFKKNRSFPQKQSPGNSFNC